MAATLTKNVALALTSTLAFAALLEAGARLLEPAPVQRQEYLWDWSERFKDGEFYTLEKGEGYPPNEENNVDGLRDAARPVETRPGLRRIVILGDSVAFGHGIDGRDAFPQVLERRLREGGRDVEVFNMALPGWSTHQEGLAYDRIARAYKPTEVVVAVCLNDLAELQINRAKPPDARLFWLFKRSALMRAVLGASRREIGAVEELFTDADSAHVANALRLFFEEVRRLRDATKADGTGFHLLVFPFKFQAEADAPTPIVQSRIRDFTVAERIPFLDYLPILQKEPNPTSLFLDYDHFNPAGHEHIATWLAAQASIVGAGAPAAPAIEATLSPARALAALRAIQPEADRELLLRRIEDAATTHLWTQPIPPSLIDAVASLAVDDVSPRVRFAAARTAFFLGRPPESSVPSLILGVQHEDPRVRAFATWTLGEMGPLAKDSVPALVALAKKDGGAGKTGALTAIGKIGGDAPDTIPLLLQELKHPKENRRYRAARTIGRMGPAGAPAIHGLIEALKDSSQLVRLTAARAIGELGEGGKPAVRALTDVVNKDADPDVRKEASATLSKLPGR